MKRVCVYLAAVTVLCYAAVTIAQAPVELYHDLKEKKEAGLMKEIAPGITWGGLVEIESIYTDSDESWSLDLATAQVNVDGVVTENITVGIVLLFEEGEDFTVDEATVALNEMLGSDLYIVGGLLTLPFGTYATSFITDPQGQGLGETSEAALQLLYETDMFSVSGTVFNADVDEAGEDDTIEDYVLAGEVTPVEGVTLSVSYISNLLAGAMSDDVVDTGLTDRTGGLGVAGSYIQGCFQVDAEYLTALDDIELVDIGRGAGDINPWTFNFEVAYCVPEIQVALKYEAADELEDESRYGVAVAKFLADNTLLSLEYMHSEKEAGGDDDSVGALLGVEF
jgi:hypothetical protein